MIAILWELLTNIAVKKVVIVKVTLLEANVMNAKRDLLVNYVINAKKRDILENYVMNAKKDISVNHVKVSLRNKIMLNQGQTKSSLGYLVCMYCGTSLEGEMFWPAYLNNIGQK